MRNATRGWDRAFYAFNFRPGDRILTAVPRLDTIENRVVELAAELRNRLRFVRGLIVRDRGVQQCGIVRFTANTPSSVIRDELRRAGINVHVSSASSTLLDMSARGLSDLIRASVHYYNTHDEIDQFVANLAKIVDR